jgi:hypothetical protein
MHPVIADGFCLYSCTGCITEGIDTINTDAEAFESVYSSRFFP